MDLTIVDLARMTLLDDEDIVVKDSRLKVTSDILHGSVTR